MIEVRALTEHREFAEAVALQKTIWGFEEIELLPVRLFVVATKVGGQVFGAFDQGRMVAFLLAIPGLKPGGKYYLHSHMMGVLSEYRNAGIGRLLKLKQREEAIGREIALVEWTFDPLEVKNAFFNIERLGAVVRRYVLNQYGTTTSALHGGLPTDRCVAEWYVDSPRVTNLLDNGSFERPPEAARIEIPVAIQQWKHQDPARAREAQAAISNQFQEHFRAGLAVTGFERAEDKGTYILSKWPS
ncbi:MAG: acetyltransferase [Acidobacteria bacterium]|nr:acetyltransferase [Acidobacteriota bacterium]